MKTKGYVLLLILLSTLILSCETISKRSLIGEYSGTKRHYYSSGGNLIDTTVPYSLEVTKEKDDILILNYTIPYDELKDDGSHNFLSPFNGELCQVSFKDDSLMGKFYLSYNPFAEEFDEYKMVKK